MRNISGCLRSESHIRTQSKEDSVHVYGEKGVYYCKQHVYVYSHSFHATLISWEWPGDKVAKSNNLYGLKISVLLQYSSLVSYM